MIKRNNHLFQKVSRFGLFLIISSVSIVLNGCSNSYERGDALAAGDEMKSGPGIFSGKKGGFYLVGDPDKVKSEKPVSKMNIDETNRVLDQKLEQLKKDQEELEALKRQLNKKVEN